MKNFVSDIVSKEISFTKENLIDFWTENGYYFGFYKGAVECLRPALCKVEATGSSVTNWSVL